MAVGDILIASDGTPGVITCLESDGEIMHWHWTLSSGTKITFARSMSELRAKHSKIWLEKTNLPRILVEQTGNQIAITMMR